MRSFSSSWNWSPGWAQGIDSYAGMHGAAPLCFTVNATISSVSEISYPARCDGTALSVGSHWAARSGSLPPPLAKSRTVIPKASIESANVSLSSGVWITYAMYLYFLIYFLQATSSFLAKECDVFRWEVMPGEYPLLNCERCLKGIWRRLTAPHYEFLSLSVCRNTPVQTIPIHTKHYTFSRPMNAARMP